MGQVKWNEGNNYLKISVLSEIQDKKNNCCPLYFYIHQFSRSIYGVKNRDNLVNYILQLF